MPTMDQDVQDTQDAQSIQDDPDAVSRLAAALAHNPDEEETRFNATTTAPANDADPNNDSTVYPPAGVTQGAVANLCSATLGAGVLAVPYSMAQAGVLGSLAWLAVAAGATLCSIRYLVQAVAFYQCDSYEHLTRFLFGKTACTAVQLCIVLFCEGVAVAYLIAVADILEQAHLLLHGSRALTMTFVWITVCVPLSLLRRMQALQFTSALGVASIATLLFAAIVHLGEDLDAEYGRHENYTTPDDNETTAWNQYFYDDMDTTLQSDHNETRHHGHFHIDDWDAVWWPLDGLRSVLQACPVILFAFSCQVNVCAIFLELPAAIHEVENDALSSSTYVLYHPSKVPLLQRVSCWAVALCTVLYAGMGWTAVANFGASHVAPNILQNYNLRDGLMQVAAAGMALAVLAAFPLNIFPSRVTCLQWEDAWRKQRRTFGQTTRRTTANNDLTAALLLDADENPEPPPEESLAEPIFPSDTNEATSRAESTPASLDDNGSEGNDSAFDNEFNVEGEVSTDWFRHVMWTFVLCGVALGLALIVPDISVVFSVLGGTTSSWLGFCVPGLLGLRLERDAIEQKSWIRYATSWLLLLGGIAIGILTTVLTVQSLLGR